MKNIVGKNIIMKQKYLIFGTGTASERFLGEISSEKEAYIVGFVDNNPEKHGKNFFGKKIFSPDSLKDLSFDKIIISSVFFNEIKTQLINTGIPSEKIDTYLDFFPNNFSQFIYLEKNKDHLENKNFSLVSNSCFGILLYRKLGLEYNSPFIGTFIDKNSYLKMLQNLNYYLSCDLKIEVIPTGIWGFLDDVLIQFPHEKNPDVALQNWNRRLKRFDFENVFVHSGFNYNYHIWPEQIYSLDEAQKIPFKNNLFIEEQGYYLTNTGALNVKKTGIIDIISWLNGET